MAFCRKSKVEDLSEVGLLTLFGVQLYWLVLDRLAASDPLEAREEGLGFLVAGTRRRIMDV